MVLTRRAVSSFVFGWLLSSWANCSLPALRNWLTSSGTCLNAPSNLRDDRAVSSDLSPLASFHRAEARRWRIGGYRWRTPPHQYRTSTPSPHVSTTRVLSLQESLAPSLSPGVLGLGSRDGRHPAPPRGNARTHILFHSSLREASTSRRRASCAPQHRSRLPLRPIESGRRAVALVGHSGNSPVSKTNRGS